MIMEKRSRLTNIRIPLTYVVPTSEFELLGIRENFKYDKNGKKTEERVGFTYVIGDPINYEKLNVKVEMKYPVISAEELKDKHSRREKVIVKFDNLTISLYWNTSLETYGDSFKADGVQLCNHNVTLQSTQHITSDLSDNDLGLD